MNNTIGKRDFSQAVNKALAKQGMVIYSIQALPGKDGLWVNGDRGYLVNDNGTSRLLAYQEVLDAARGKNETL